MLIPGHNVTVAVYKETSINLIKSFEGTYTGDRNGILNITFRGDDYSIVADSGEIIEGTLIKGEINLNQDGTVINGSFQGQDSISGRWENNKGQSGTWSCRRTL